MPSSTSGWKRGSSSMNIQPDFEDFLRLLETHRVDYMIIGGYAVAFHGFPRFTKDLDVFFDPTPENAVLLRQVLIDFGFREASVPLESLQTPGNMIVIGTAPVRIDLVSRIDGVTFADAKPHVVRGRYGTVDVTFIGRQDLLCNKRATPRAKDKADVEELS